MEHNIRLRSQELDLKINKKNGSSGKQANPEDLKQSSNSTTCRSAEEDFKILRSGNK